MIDGAVPALMPAGEHDSPPALEVPVEHLFSLDVKPQRAQVREDEARCQGKQQPFRQPVAQTSPR